MYVYMIKIGTLLKYGVVFFIIIYVNVTFESVILEVYEAYSVHFKIKKNIINSLPT